jgi:hypothetical protein
VPDADPADESERSEADSDRGTRAGRPPDAVSVSDHLAPTTADRLDGVYRVVGTDEDAVTLLRVGDAEGRRVHTGEVVTVPRAHLTGFEPVATPDESVPARAAVASTVRMAGWSVRAFLAQVRSHPGPAGVALALVTVGWYGGRFPGIPDAVAGVAILLGSLGVAYVGSGRL